ncbi:MAG: ribonuclease P protein component [Verrucomicrobiales bacterium]|nr:ribonuclease P protein component [Verrucomicrobiales bacterium]
MTPPRQRLRLPRSRRLRRSHEFRQTRTHGERLSRGCLILNWRPRSDLPAARLGVVTSRRVGNAVERSRARRLLREAFRSLQHGIRPPADVVLVARPSIQGRTMAEVHRHLRAALETAKIWRPGE